MAIRFEVDLSRTFPTLSNPPIVEAIIDWRFRSAEKWDYSKVASFLRDNLPDYPETQEQRTSNAHFSNDPSSGRTSASLQDLGVSGVVFRNADKSHVAQFQQDGFAFSGVGKYSGWSAFLPEAQRLRSIFQKVYPDSQIVRLGQRTINQIALPQLGDGTYSFEAVLSAPPMPPSGLDILHNSFFVAETFLVSGSKSNDYVVNLVRTIPEPTTAQKNQVFVIVDIDVSTSSIMLEPEEVSLQIEEMHWVKNLFFFSSLTDSAIKTYK